MTSTQVKKAYRKSNRAPKISRVEQRRRDAEELQRQKKEWEREQAAVKAKAAREKKAGKLRDEKEKRKREGVPDPRKGVRPSQARISCFVRREGDGGNKRRWEEVAEESEDTVGEDSEPRLAKKILVRQEDEFGGDDMEDLNLPDLFRQLDEPISSFESGVNKKNAGVTPWASPREQICQSKIVVGNKDEERDLDDSQVLAEMATTQLLTEAAKSFSEEQEPKMKATRLDKDCLNMALKPPANARALTSKTKDKSKPSPLPMREPLQERSGNMQPPPRPMIARKPSKPDISMTPLAPRSKAAPRTVSKSPVREYKQSLANWQAMLPSPLHKPIPATHPPSATQAFLESHMDDFFPSPSQQARELLDDITEYDLPSNTQVMRELSPDTDILDKEMPFAELICTQDLMSSQEIQELETPCPPSQKAVQKMEVPPVEQMQFEEMFLAQDFDLSQQDLEEIGSPCWMPPPPAPALKSTTLAPSSPKANDIAPAMQQHPTTHIPPPKTSAMQTTKQSSPSTTTKPAPSKLPPQNIPNHSSSAMVQPDSKKPAPPKAPKKRFFIEKEEPLPRAPTPPPPGPPTVPSPGLAHKERGRFFQEKEDDLLQAAIRQSLAPSQQVIMPVDSATKETLGRIGGEGRGDGWDGKENISGEGARRTVQRTASAVTDYGDLDFFDLGDFAGEVWDV